MSITSTSTTADVQSRRRPGLDRWGVAKLSVAWWSKTTHPTTKKKRPNHQPVGKGTLRAANNYADCLVHLQRFEEAKALMRKTIPVAQRVFGASHEFTFRMRWIYAEALYKDGSATLDDLREAVTMLDDIARTARRVLGGSHPTTTGIEGELEDARAALRASG